MLKQVFSAVALLGAIAFSSAQTLDKSSVINNFRNNENPIWNIPIDNTTLKIDWRERKNSFQNEGIRTFVGYLNDNFIGVVSVNKNNDIYGEISYNGNDYKIDSKGGNITLNLKKDGGAECKAIHQHAEATAKNKAVASLSSENAFSIENNPYIFSDNVLRTYRLAMLVDFSAFRYEFALSTTNVKTFWANLETFLNEVYLRDVGIKFVMVNDDRLIVKESKDEIYKGGASSDYIAANSTELIKSKIEDDLFDLGFTSTFNSSTGENGVAGMYMAHSKSGRAYAYSIPRIKTIGHEIGHLFGSDHTFSEGGVNTMKTEPGRGLSLMSYAIKSTRDYFSLPSISYIRRGIGNNNFYYEDEARTKEVGIGAGTNRNIVFGKVIPNKAPVINTLNLKEKYTLPKDTSFQFRIEAADPDGHELYYTAHQFDITRYGNSKAMFIAKKPSKNNLIEFHRIYDEEAHFPIVGTDPSTFKPGTYTMWLGVNDGHSNTEKEEANYRSPQYDVFKTNIEIVDNAKPFKLVDGFKGKTFTAGQKVQLNWTVDENIFKDYKKVRILLSDDYGKSFKYVLADGVENNGSYEVTLPHIAIKKVNRLKLPVPGDVYLTTGLGIIKVEVVGHIAHAISDNTILGGGFTVKADKLRFENLPEQVITIKKGENLPRADVKAFNADNSPVNVEVKENNKEAKTANKITRTWTAKNGNSEQISYTQTINIKEEVTPLKFTEDWNGTKHYQCVKDVPKSKEKPKFTGGKNAKIDFSEVQFNEINGNAYIQRTWRAVDEVADPISMVEKIMVMDTQAPEFSKYPQDMVIQPNENFPVMETLTATDNCSGATKVDIYQKSIYDMEKQVTTGMLYRWYTKDNAGNERIHEQTIRKDYDGTLGTKEAKASESKIYPNPVKDVFHLDWKGKISKIEMYDLSGKLVKSFTPNTENEYSVSSLPKGVYIVTVTGDAKNKSFKIIKE